MATRKKAVPRSVNIPKTHKASETTYKLTAETYYYPKPKAMPKAMHRPSKPAPMPVKVVGVVKTK